MNSIARNILLHHLPPSLQGHVAVTAYIATCNEHNIAITIPNLLFMQQGIPCTQEPTEEQRLQLLADVLRFPAAELPVIKGITMGIYGPLIELEEPALRPGLYDFAISEVIDTL